MEVVRAQVRKSENKNVKIEKKTRIFTCPSDGAVWFE